MSNSADFDLVWCAKLAWAQCLPNPGGWSSGWCVFLSQFRWAQHFCLSSTPALLPSPALRTDRALVLKVIYLFSSPPGAQVDSRRACSFLPACLSLKDDPWTCLPVSATHNKWGMNRQLHLRGGKWIQKGEIQANLVPILKSHVDTVQTLIYLYIQQPMQNTSV